MVRITLVDLHGALTTEAQKQGWSEITLLPWTNIKDIPLKHNTAFISPANSLGYQDGGIDYVLSRVMFPGLEPTLKKAIRNIGHKTLLGRFYLPIGSAVTVETCKPGVFLIAAPTMWLPQDVRNTHNAYHAMYAIMKEASVRNFDEIYLCGLATGCGAMSADNAIAQMKAAYDDFIAKRPPRYSAEDIKKEQPKYYENTEFKDIAAGEIVHQ